VRRRGGHDDGRTGLSRLELTGLFGVGHGRI
jgi:hypothetical protein